MATNIPSGSLANVLTKTIPTDIPLQEQIDRFVALGAEYVPEEMVRQVNSHIEQLVESGVAEFAVKEYDGSHGQNSIGKLSQKGPLNPLSL